ncbi:MAG: hypothetical protein CMB80_05825 [Flammeovirgaceae bacterium]|nr:hypothetical protein [Flammeovirgaceae bacterium]|tara:strand:+ start:1083 stop:2306 length:1224 start_codon:yes stop_codon:yes gene_type:complete
MSDEQSDLVVVQDNTKIKAALMKVKRAKSRLLLKHPFWGQLVTNLKDQSCYDVPIGATDGKVFYYNPDWVESATMDEIIFLIAHEAAHCALLHLWRRGDKDAKAWNIAADYVVNDMLVEARIGKMPSSCLFDDKYKGMHAEKIYSRILKDGDDTEGGFEVVVNGSGFSGAWDGHGYSRDADEEVNWKATTNSAAQSTMGGKGRGDIPAGMQRVIDGFTKPSINWVALLAAFVDALSKNDYSFLRQNRRFIYQELYLPSLYSHDMGEIAMFVDTSGSMSQDDISKSMSEVMGILTTYTPECVHFGSCDTEVQVEIKTNHELSCTETAMKDILDSLQGGGGTSFLPVFDYIKEQAKVKFLIYFTDGYGVFPDPNDIDIPVFWCVTPHGLQDDQFPFGKVIRLPDFREND